jgi:hypothetical protein
VFEPHLHPDVVRLELVTRKSKQTGGNHTYPLVKIPAGSELEWLCPYTALLRLFAVYRKAGVFEAADWEQRREMNLFLFVEKDGSVRPDLQISVRNVREWLKADLKEISKAGFSLYGSHCFRRGGTQWWHREKKRDLISLCRWGGWSVSVAMTVVRYLYSEEDLVQVDADAFMQTCDW